MLQFLRTDASSPQLPHHHPRRRIRQNSRVRQRRSRGRRQRKHTQNRISGPCDIKHLPSARPAFHAALPHPRISYLKTRRWNLQMSRRSLLENAHPLLPASDHHCAAPEVREQRPSRLFHRFFISERPRHKKTRLLRIANDRPRPTLRIQTGSLRLHKNGHLQLMRRTQNAVRKIVRNQSLVIVGKHQRIQTLQRIKQGTEQLLFRLQTQRLPPLLIHAHDLLMPCDDARLHGGHPLGIRNHSLFNNASRPQTLPQGPSSLVGSNRPKHLDPRPQRRQIRRHIPCPAQTLALRNKIHHRHCRFRRKPRSRSPQIPVQHQIAKHTDVLPAQLRNEFFQTGQVFSNLDRHSRSFPASSSRCLVTSLLRLFDLCLFRQHHRNVIPHGIHSSARFALQPRMVRGKLDGRLADRTNQNLQQLFRNPHTPLHSFLNQSFAADPSLYQTPRKPSNHGRAERVTRILPIARPAGVYSLIHALALGFFRPSPVHP